jgi:hypothetical protein
VNRKRFARIARWLLAVMVGLELAYILIANAVILSGVIQKAVGANPEVAALSWDWAYSPWPGRAYVSGLALRVQDPSMQFRLTVDFAEMDIALRDLLRQKFHVTHVRGERVSYRMLAKVDAVKGNEARLAAFPPLEGFGPPSLRPNPLPPMPTSQQLDALWAVQLDDADVDAVELWFLEYRYLGKGHVRGGFALQPLRTLWVGPAVVELDGGVLSAGAHVLSSSFTARISMALPPVDLIATPGLQVLEGLGASIHIEAAIEDLGAVDLYAQGLKARGHGRLAAHLQIQAGRLQPGSALEASLLAVDARLRGYQFAGHGQLKLEVKEHAPGFKGALQGTLRVPFPGAASALVHLSDFTTEVVLAEETPAPNLRLERLTARLGSARIEDASAISSWVGTRVPVVGPAVLGGGPFLASATARITPASTLVRLERASLGSATFAGAAVARGGDWKGSVAGRFGLIPLGLELRDGSVKGVPFAPPGWLSASLRAAGIAPVPDG